MGVEVSADRCRSERENRQENDKNRIFTSKHGLSVLPLGISRFT